MTCEEYDTHNQLIKELTAVLNDTFPNVGKEKIERVSEIIDRLIQHDINSLHSWVCRNMFR